MIARYASGLQSIGHEVTILSLTRPRSSRLYRGLHVVALEQAGFVPSPRTVAAAVLSLRRKIADVGVVVATWTPTLPVAFGLRHLCGGSRLVWLAMDYPEMFAGRRVMRFALRHGALLCDATVAISQACAAHAGGMSRRRNMVVIPIGLDACFGPSIGPSGRRSGLLFVGDAGSRKGLGDFLAAYENVVARAGPVPYTLVLREPPQMPLPAGGRVLSQVSDQELAAEYHRASIYVCASRAEGWGLPALEAMACGAAVITTAHQGCEAYARHEENCLVVPIAQPIAMADSICRLLATPDLREQLISKGYTMAAEMSWDNAIHRFQEVCIPETPIRNMDASGRAAKPE